MSYRLGIDVGGTFTDLLLFNEETGAMTLEKTPSTPADQSIGILNGIHKIVDTAGLSPQDLDLIFARHDRCDQRGFGGKRRTRRADYDQRF